MMPHLLRWLSYALCLAMVCLCAFGCATSHTRAATISISPIPGGRPTDMAGIADALRMLPGTRIRTLEGHWNEEVFQAECVISDVAEGKRIILLAPHMRLATITLKHNGGIDWECAYALPKTFEPEYALLDLAQAELDTPTLRKALGPGFRVTENLNRRLVYREGMLIGERRSEKDGSFAFHNPIHGYHVIVREVKQ